MPFEFDFDFGAENGNAVIGRFLPRVSIPLGERWQMNNLTLAIVASAPGGRPGFPGNPEPIKGGQVFGLGDWTNASIFLPPLRSKNFFVGFGPALGLPVATDPLLGSQKWTIGPILRIGYRPGKWNFNALIINLWSYAGNPDRKAVNQLLIRGLIRYQFNEKWFFTSNPIITSNWKASAGQRWLCPLGGGMGRAFPFAGRKISIAFHGYYNVIRPEGAPTGLFRIDLLYPLPGSRKSDHDGQN